MTTDNNPPCEYHLSVIQDNQDSVELVSNSCGLSRQRVKQVMQKGAVWLTRGKKTRRIRRAKTPTKPGDTIHLYYDESVLSEEPPVPEIIADEGGYSIWNKPCGMLSQGSKWGDHCTINRWVEKNFEPSRPCFIVHRLDKAANGLILLAHSKTMARQLSAMFASRNIEKKYHVTVHGAFPATPKTITANSPLDGKTACSHFQRLHYDELQDTSLLDVCIETGRKHQIRKHLAELGFPVVGDRLYGNKGLYGDQFEPLLDLQLQAYSLQFSCPVSGTLKTFQLATTPAK